MKQTILYLLLGTFLLASCQQEETLPDNTATGYLVLESIDVQVNQQTVSSRAVDADLYVDILPIASNCLKEPTGFMCIMQLLLCLILMTETVWLYLNIPESLLR